MLFYIIQLLLWVNLFTGLLEAARFYILACNYSKYRGCKVLLCWHLLLMLNTWWLPYWKRIAYNASQEKTNEQVANIRHVLRTEFELTDSESVVVAKIVCDLIPSIDYDKAFWVMKDFFTLHQLINNRSEQERIKDAN